MMLNTQMENIIEESLLRFNTISLDEMNDKVRLMNRVDTKFVFNDYHLLSILEELKSDYYVLYVDDTRLAPYETLYFDTEDLGLFENHHNQRGTRHKIRYRRYVNSDINFFELKEKINTGRTIKKRIPTGTFSWDSYQSSFKLFAQFYLKNTEANLSPSLWVYFSRITLAKKDYTERATLDVGITFKGVGLDAPIKRLHNIAILEAKQPKLDRSSPIVRTLKKHAIYPMRISKYCTGVTKCYNGIKTNRFKEKMLTLERMSGKKGAEKKRIAYAF